MIRTNIIIEGLPWFGGLLIWSCAVGYLVVCLHRRWTHPCCCEDCELHTRLLEMAAWERGFRHGKALADKREINRQVIQQHVAERGL